jgi:hypothetical protein
MDRETLGKTTRELENAIEKEVNLARECERLEHAQRAAADRLMVARNTRIQLMADWLKETGAV